ncbi:MAG: response regulator [Gammaproteobacteria bacterium]|nr:response regulator [Gammaproteobacteria bacterium]
MNENRTVKRIVIVDDEEAILRVMKRAIEQAFQAEITTFSDPFAAMNFVISNPVDLAIVDYKMPSINGVDFLAALKSARPEMVRIIMSGQADSDFLKAAINEAEVFRFIKIPWDIEELHTIVYKALKRQN